MTKKIDLFYSALHIPVDAIAILLAFITSYWLRGDGTEIYRLPYQEYLTLVYRAAPIWLAIFVLQGMYAKRNLFASLQNFSHTAMTVLASWASFVVFLVFLKNEQTLVFPRLMLIYILIFGIVYIVGFRVLLRVFRLLMRSLGFGRTQLAILGATATAKALEEMLSSQRDLSVNFRQRFHAISPEELTKELKKERVDQLIIADESLDNGKLFEYIRATQNAGVSVSIVPNMFEVQARNIVVETFAGLPLMTLRQTPLEGWGRIVKRVIDIVFASIALIVLSPVYLAVALLIAMFDPGPIFFAQKRIARGGKMMKIYKFRTMSSKWSGKPPIEVFKQLGRDDLVKEFEATQKVKTILECHALVIFCAKRASMSCRNL
jgi:hypothetical protein